MRKNSRIVIVGATSSMAEHCARIWIQEIPDEIYLIGRNKTKLDAIATDLNVRSPKTKIQTTVMDFTDAKAIDKLAEELCGVLPLDIVLIAHGILPNQKVCQRDLEVNEESLLINGVSPVLFAEAFAERMTKFNTGTIAVIGSVAGDRGRKSNYVYGAAKGLVNCYVQGMQHRFASTGLSVVLIKPGPTDTPMTEEFKKKGVKLASVEDVARVVTRGILSGKKCIYAPGKWSLIMMVIRHLPNFVFNKMDI